MLGGCDCVQGVAPAVRVVTYHGAQSGSARGAATTLTTNPQASAHEVHDAKEGFWLARDRTILCHVGGANTGNYGIEDATFASWSRKLWFLHRFQLKWSAHQVAHALLRHRLPNHYIGRAEAASVQSVQELTGWTYHINLSLAPWCPSTHTDPGAMFPHRWFARYIAWYYRHPHIHAAIALDKKGNLKTARRARRHTPQGKSNP